MAEYTAYPNIPQAKVLEEFLEAQGIQYQKLPDEKLPQHVLDGIAEGQADFAAGRFITFDEFKKRLKINK